MKIPTIFDVYESMDCRNIISPYIIKYPIDDIVKRYVSSGIGGYVESIFPDLTFIRGTNPTTYDSSYKSQITENRNSSNFYSDNTSTKTDQCIPHNNYANNVPKILPPHRVFQYCTNDKNDVFESNVYIPCLQNPGVYPTGGYPNEVPTYDSNAPTAGSMIPSAREIHNEQLLQEIQRKLHHELIENLFEGIQKIQISNLLSALVQSHLIPLDDELITSLRIAFVSILNTDSVIQRIGVFLDNKRSIYEFPHHPNRKYSVFIQVGDNSVKDEVIGNISDVIKLFSNNIGICVLTKDEFIILQKSNPIPVCFECRGGCSHRTIPSLELTLVNENKFIPNINIYAAYPIEAVRILSPSNKMSVPFGSSGKVCFDILSSNDFKYEVCSVTVNHTTYTIDQLLDPEKNLKGSEYSNLYAELSNNDIAGNKILTLYYTAITKDITILVEVARVINTEDFHIQTEEISSRSNYGDIHIDNSAEKFVEMCIPFNVYMCGCMRVSDKLRIYDIRYIRNDNGYEKISDSSSTPFKIGMITVPEDGSLVKKSYLTLQIDEQLDYSKEFLVHFNQGLLLAKDPLDAGHKPSSCMSHVTNSLIELRFSVNAVTGKVDIISDESYIPDYILDTFVKDDTDDNPENTSSDNNSAQTNGETVVSE